MNWKIINYSENNGKFNMDFDLKLASLCKSENAFLRFYGWNPYCISLGANQSFDDINMNKIRKDDIDVVKRPTGGRAILHAQELTYSLTIPALNDFTGRELYNRISFAIINGLRSYDSKLHKVELENIQPDFRNLVHRPEGTLCFASTAKSEIKFDGKKLVGSAQRKIGSTILQHGSILIGRYHRNLTKYLKTSDNTLLHTLDNSTIELESILNKKVDIHTLIDSIINGFEIEWDICFKKTGQLSTVLS